MRADLCCAVGERRAQRGRLKDVADVERHENALGGPRRHRDVDAHGAVAGAGAGRKLDVGGLEDGHLNVGQCL